jgi:beta-glucosidase
MTIDEKIDCLGVQTGAQWLRIPSYGGSEGVHGVVQRGNERHLTRITTTRFPQPPGMGEMWGPTLVRRQQRLKAMRRGSLRRRRSTIGRF